MTIINRFGLRRDDAVSPVVGVMLMLVVTIIIAAVVSGFAGNLATSAGKAPTLVATANLEITGDKDSRLYIRVDSVSEPISTKDLRIITSWSKDVDGTIIRGGNTSNPNEVTNSYSSTYESQPFGFGPGVEDWAAYGTRKSEQHFGNYTLEAGTVLYASPYRGRITSGNDLQGGYGPRLNSDTGVIVGTSYEYHDGTNYVIGTHIDGMQSVLGGNWNVLRPGDIVNVKIIHIPSGRAIFDRDVAGTGRSFL